MKVRLDFVTNSSTSCYICQVCGAKESGFDADAGELGFKDCPEGHIFCNGHVRGEVTVEDQKQLILNYEFVDDKLKELLRSLDGDAIVDFIEEHECELDDALYALDPTVPERLCPICSLRHVLDEDLVPYLLIQLGAPKECVLERIRADFSDLKEMKEWCDEN